MSFADLDSSGLNISDLMGSLTQFNDAGAQGFETPSFVQKPAAPQNFAAP